MSVEFNESAALVQFLSVKCWVLSVREFRLQFKSCRLETMRRKD